MFTMLSTGSPLASTQHYFPGYMNSCRHPVIPPSVSPAPSGSRLPQPQEFGYTPTPVMGTVHGIHSWRCITCCIRPSHSSQSPVFLHVSLDRMVLPIDTHFHSISPTTLSLTAPLPATVYTSGRILASTYLHTSILQSLETIRQTYQALRIFSTGGENETCLHPMSGQEMSSEGHFITTVQLLCLQGG